MQIFAKSKPHKKRDGQRNYWQSYSDMMAALLLVFILVMASILLQSTKMYEEKLVQQSNAQAEIDRQMQQLKEQESILVEQQAQLAAQEEKLHEQQQVMDNQQQQLDKIIGVKREIISDLQREFKGSELAIRINDETGSISFDADLLFDPDQYVLRQTSKVFLDSFLPRYFSILMSEKYVDNVAEIIIEGHTAHYGTYLDCLNLSQERALAVAQYALSDNSKLTAITDMEKLRTVITVNGRAWYDPVYTEDGSLDDANSRRVEIKFRLKDEEMIDAMIEILEKGE